MTASIELLLSMVLLSAPLSAGAPPEFSVPPAAAAPGELREVRDRLMTGLFLRGQLADSIMDAGLQERFVGAAPGRTRSEVRQALMDWIYANPDKAADLYFYLRDRAPSGKERSGEISYAEPVWNLRRHFLDMAALGEKAAADRSMSDEEISLAAQRLFSAAQAQPEAPAPVVPGAYGAEAPGADGLPELADYLLHPDRVEGERRALAQWLENLKSAAEADRVSGGGEGLERSELLLEETFMMYRDLAVVLSDLKSVKRISGTQAGRVETMRRAFRRNLYELEALAAVRRLDKALPRLAAAAPGGQALRSEGLDLRRGFSAFLAEIGADRDGPYGAERRLYELEKKADLWALGAFIHGRLFRVKTDAEGRVFSCVLDALMFRYLSLAHPLSGYVRAAGTMSAAAAALDDGMEAAADLAGGRGDAGALLARAAAWERSAAALRSYSGLNRRLQFIFWDSLFNPSGLRPGPEGLRASLGF